MFNILSKTINDNKKYSNKKTEYNRGQSVTSNFCAKRGSFLPLNETLEASSC